MSAFVVISVSITIFMLLIWSLTSTCPINESWIDYEELPYGNIRSGSGYGSGSNFSSGSSKCINSNKQLDFYNYPIYRRPLNWPVCHIVDYPTPHCRSDSL